MPTAPSRTRDLRPLDQERLWEGLRWLSGRDPDLARILDDHGPPPLWDREPGFPTLVHIILEQQVSLASARAAYDRLVERVSPLTPAGFLELDDPTLKTIGFSRQKTGYARGLAQALLDGRLDLDGLGELEDDAVRAALTALKGIGPWTADIYLLMVLRRPDIWPVGDLALAVAAQRVKGLAACPDKQAFEALGTPWRPWRAVAARLLWHFYLSVGPSPKGPGTG